MLKKFQSFVLIIFFLILLSVPAFWVVKGKPSPQMSLVEGRVLGLPEKNYPTLKIAMGFIQQGKIKMAASLVWDLFTGGSLQRKVDGAATDQFPLRMPIIDFSKSLDRRIIGAVYGFTPDDFIPADMTSDLYIALKENALINPPHTLSENDFLTIDQRLANYRELISKYPDKSFYIYYIETVAFSQTNPLNAIFTNADQGKTFEYLQDHLPKKIKLGKLTLESFNDHLTYFYRTDHHWNTDGILTGYRDIYEMLSKNYPSIPEKLEPELMVTFPGIEFIGTLGRQTLYPIPGDQFIGFEAEFTECVVKDGGVEGKYDDRDDYLAGNYSTLPYTSHYGNYFGTQNALLEYECQTDVDRNILIIGNSYARPLVALIATQYQHTYFVDLRQVPDFALSNFLDEYQIEDILIVGDADIVYLDAELWMIKP